MFNCFIFVGEQYRESKNFNDLDSLCKDYKKKNGSRGASQNIGKTEVKSSKTEEVDQISQSCCNPHESLINQNTYETPISNISTQENSNHASKKEASDHTKAKLQSGSNSKE